MADLNVPVLTSLLTPAALTGLSPTTLVKTTPTVANLLKTAGFGAQAQVVACTLAELASLTVPDFTTVFVSDIGGNGTGSLWVRQGGAFTPIAKRISLYSSTSMWATAATNTPVWETALDITIPAAAMPDGAALRVMFHPSTYDGLLANTGGSIQGLITYKALSDGSSVTFQFMICVYGVAGVEADLLGEQQGRFRYETGGLMYAFGLSNPGLLTNADRTAPLRLRLQGQVGAGGANERVKISFIDVSIDYP